MTRFRRDQHRHDDPRLAPIDHVVGMVSQMASLPFDGHDGGIRVSCTDYEVSYAPIGAPHDLSVRFSSLLDPVVALFIVLSERFIFLR